MRQRRNYTGNGLVPDLVLLNIEQEELGTERGPGIALGIGSVPATPIPRSPISSGDLRAQATTQGKSRHLRVSGLLERCDLFQKELKGQRHEATSSLTTRIGEWAQTKEFLSDLNHKAAWRHSPLYQHRKALITARLLTNDDPLQAQDKRVILTTASPEPSGGQAFLTVDHLTQARLRSLAQVSRREFGLQPLSRQEVVRNLQYRDHPTVRILERKQEVDLIGSNSPDIPVTPYQKRALTYASNKEFPKFHREKARKPTETGYFTGKLHPRKASETLILDQMVKSRLVKMQRAELLS